ncbi:MAG TPA: hypothetical protein VEF04_16235 [Blastocatellia bacterium]|nr:hypothetical protein [Blastocatellia bacterium]
MSQSISIQQPAKWRVWVWPILFWAATALLLGLPLIKPHGPFLWGHYKFADIYLGGPLLFAALLSTAVSLKSEESRRLLALRLTVLWLSVVVFAVLFDVIYALFVVGAWRADYWLDQAHIARRFAKADQELGFVRKPNLKWRGILNEDEREVEYNTDEHGFRNQSGLSHAEIVFLGDSYTEAAQVTESQTFVQRVAQLTGQSTVNLGRGAYGPQQELIVLKRYGLAYKPSVVVWQIFEGNDLNDADNFAKWRQNPHQEPLSLAHRYVENSLLQVLLSSTRQEARLKALVTIKFSDQTTRTVPLRYRYEPRQPEMFPVGFAETKQSLAEGQRLCREQGIELLVVYVPIMARVMEPYLTFDNPASREHFLSRSGIDQPTDTGHQLAEFCRQNNIAFLDSFTALRQRAESDNRGLYIPADEHLDVQGQEVIAQAITAWLRAKTRAQSSQY